jgi:hypothetical protein
MKIKRINEEQYKLRNEKNKSSKFFKSSLMFS